MTNFFLTGFYKKQRTGWTPRLHPAPVAEMGSRATFPSTVNLRVPAVHRSGPAEECSGPGVPQQGVQPKFERAANQEKGIPIKDLDDSRSFRAGDPSQYSPSDPFAKGKEKQGLGKTSRAGKLIQGSHEQSLNPGKKVHLGECSKPAASLSDIPPSSSSELADDHPLKQEEGSMLHSSFLVVVAHDKKMFIEDLVVYLEMSTPWSTKFPDNWWNELENELMGNRHFLKSKGFITVCEDLRQSPSERIVNTKEKPSVVIEGQNKNLAERAYGMSTECEVQERTLLLNLAVRTPRLPKPSEDDIDWTPSMEKLEQAAPRGGRRGPPIATKCAKLSGTWRCNSDALLGKLYCACHMRSSLLEQ